MKTKKEIELIAQEIQYSLYNQGLDANGCFNQYQGFIKGYTQCQGGKSEKYTEEDMLKAFYAGINADAKNGPSFEIFIKNLSK